MFVLVWFVVVVGRLNLACQHRARSTISFPSKDCASPYGAVSEVLCSVNLTSCSTNQVYSNAVLTNLSLPSLGLVSSDFRVRFSALACAAVHGSGRRPGRWTPTWLLYATGSRRLPAGLLEHQTFRASNPGASGGWRRLPGVLNSPPLLQDNRPRILCRIL